MSNQEAPGKEVAGKKMALAVIGIILVASILAVSTILLFYVVWDPKPALEIDTEQTSVILPMLDYWEMTEKS